jgi:hypothetical protein
MPYKDKAAEQAYLERTRAHRLAGQRTRDTKRRTLQTHRDKQRKHSRNWRGLPEPTRPMPDACEICGGDPVNASVLSLDHEHLTGTFRGWLCSPCNLGLGNFRDSSDLLVAAARYLRSHQL